MKDEYKNSYKSAILFTIVSIIVTLVIVFFIPALYKMLSLGDGSLDVVRTQLYFIIPSFIFIVVREWVLCLSGRPNKKVNGSWKKIVKVLPTILLVLAYLSILSLVIIPIVVSFLNPPENGIAWGNVVIFLIIFAAVGFILYKLGKKIVLKIPNEIRHFSVITFGNVLVSVFPLILTGAVFLIIVLAIIVLAPIVLWLISFILKFI